MATNSPNQMPTTNSAILDVLRSVIVSLRENVTENVHLYKTSYYNELVGGGFHETPKSKLPQIVIGKIRITEDRVRRSFYPQKVKNIPNLSYINNGNPFFYYIHIPIDIVSTSYNHGYTILERLIEFWKDNDHLIELLTGPKYPLDITEESVSIVGANFSDLNIISYSLTVSQIPIYGTRDFTGRLTTKLIGDFNL